MLVKLSRSKGSFEVKINLQFVFVKCNIIVQIDSLQIDDFLNITFVQVDLLDSNL